MRLLFLLVASICFAQSTITKIVGPVIPTGQSPWPWYDSTESGNAAAIAATGIVNPPVLGAVSAGTWTLGNTCTITLTNNSTGAAEFVGQQWAIVKWNGPSGAGADLFAFHIGSISGSVMTSDNACGLPVNISSSTLTGLSVYHLQPDTATSVYNDWSAFGNASTTWNFYDVGEALYLWYLRTGNSGDLTNFRTFTDEWFEWSLDGSAYSNSSWRGMSLLSQWIRALDGGLTSRLTPLYNIMANAWTFNVSAHYTGEDNREPGYYLLYTAVGAMADPTNRAAYCSNLTTLAQEWVAYQMPNGVWPEKNLNFPYAIGGESPWRVFSVNQGMARAYDALKDATVCNNPTLAASVLASIKLSASFIYNAGFTLSNRAMFYDVNYPSDGEDGINTPGAGTVTATVGSATIVGSGTSFTTAFTPNASYIGVYDSSTNNSWTYLVTGVTDNTHLTIATNYGSAGSQYSQYVVAPPQTFGYPAGGANCPSYVPSNCTMLFPANVSGTTYYIAQPAATNCNTTAVSCWAGSGSAGGFTLGDPNNIRDSIWIMGWLYNRTGILQYKTWGDELFSSSYGGPAGGAGAGFPGALQACGGPNCVNIAGSGRETDFNAALIACAQVNTVPCNAQSNFGGGVAPYGNTYISLGKRYGQGSGIGGADNYLAWRLTGSTGSISVRGPGISLRGIQ